MSRFPLAQTARTAVFLMLLIATAVGPVPLRAEEPDQIIIEAARVSPEVLTTSLERPVIFRNRSRRPVDVVFLGYRGMHHVSGVSDSISVLFHATGRHPYIVNFSDSRWREHLHGMVDIEETGATPKDPLCRGITVREICIPP